MLEIVLSKFITFSIFFYTAYIHCAFKMQLKTIKFYDMLCSDWKIFVLFLITWVVYIYHV